MIIGYAVTLGWMSFYPVTWWTDGQWFAWATTAVLLAYGWASHVSWMLIRRVHSSKPVQKS